MYRYLLIGIVILGCFASCKKDSNAPAPPVVTIVGKWFLAKQSTALFYNGEQISSTIDSTFNTTDFVIYYSDGTGYYSKFTSTGPSLTEFTYTIKGTAITQFSSVEIVGTPETVTNLTASNLSIHVVSLVADPNDPELTDTEIDDVNYKK